VHRRDVPLWPRIVDHVTAWAQGFFGHVVHWAQVVLHWVTHWPWSTIAAFAAAAAALWIAHAETRARQQLLGREAVIELGAVSLNWSNQAAHFLGAIRRALDGTGPRATVNKESLNRLTEATRAATRAVMSAQMVFTDAELLDRAAETESQIAQFMGIMQRPATRTPEGMIVPVTESAAQEQERLNGAVTEGLRRLDAFGPVTDALVQRGLQVYSPRRGSRHRIFQPRFDPHAAAAARHRRQRRRRLPSQNRARTPIDKGVTP
jgi:hypothetical protein